MIDQERVGEEGGEYTVSRVLSILSGEPCSLDEAIDVAVALSSMPEPERTFLQLWSIGYSAIRAMEEAGVKGNSTRYKQAALTRLTRLINGEENGKEDSPDK